MKSMADLLAAKYPKNEFQIKLPSLKVATREERR